MIEFKKEYLEYLPILQLCDDVYNGSVTASKYLQKYTRESDTKFKERQNNCTLDNFVKRTVDSIVNIIFRKPLTIEDNVPIYETIDLKNDLNTFAKNITKAIVKDGYTFILVDAPKVDGVRSKLDELRLGIRPYFVQVDRKNVVNWREGEWVIIREYYSEYNGFKEVIKEQFRVFYANGVVEIYRDGSLVEQIRTAINTIPIIKVGVDDIPMIYDQAKLNVLLMNRNCELDNYIRIASAPIPVTYMMSDDSRVITVGVNDGINFDAPKNEAGFEWVGLEAKNTQAIRERIESYETQMLNIAVTFATSNKVKTATQVEKEATEDESKLANIAQLVEVGINNAIELLGLYDSTYKNLKPIEVNRDYDSNKLTPEDVAQNLQLYREGVISLDTLWDLLEKGEVLTIEDREREKAGINEIPEP